MAIRDKDGFWRGKKGDSILRRVNNQQVLSQATKSQTQTGPSIASSSEFGLASNTARAIRMALATYHTGLDGSLNNRFNGVVIAALCQSAEAESGRRDIHDASTQPLIGLQFNQHAPLNKLLKVRPLVTILDNNMLNVTLPGFQVRKELSYPKSGFNTGCTIRITQYAFDFQNEFYIPLGSREVEITQPQFEGFDWNFDECLPPGSLAIACMSLHYYIQGAAGEHKVLNIKEFSPAELIAAYHIPPDPSPEVPAYRDNYLPLDGYRGNEMLRNKDPRWAW